MKEEVKTTMEMLHAIEKVKQIYDIHYCRAGVGFIFYYPEKNKRNKDNSWKEALNVDRYYPTFEEAVAGEYDKIFAIKK